MFTKDTKALKAMPWQIWLFVYFYTFIDAKINYPNPKSVTCNFHKDISTVLKNHIKAANNIYVIALHNTKTDPLKASIAELIPKLFNFQEIHKPVIVNAFYFNETSNRRNIWYENSLNLSLVQKEVSKCPPKHLFTTGYERGNAILLIGKTPDIFYKYVTQYSQSRNFWRNLHILVLVRADASTNDASVLRKIWERKRLLNSIMYMPCSSSLKEHIYIYRPFEIKDKNYGVIKMLNPSSIKNCPYLLFNHVKNLNRRPLKISVFARKTSAYEKPPKLLIGDKRYKRIPNTSEMYGSDGVLTSEISIAMNFTIIKSLESRDFGSIFHNLTATESAGEVARKQVELQGNPRFLVFSNLLKEVEYTTYFSQDKVCLIVNKSPFIPKWLKPFMDIRLSIWGYLTVCTIVSIIFNDLFKFSKDKNMMVSSLEVFGAFFSQASAITSHNGRPGRRSFLSCLLFCTMILSSIFAAIMYKSFTTASFFSDINTLAAFDDANLSIMSSLSVFKENPMELYQRLEKKSIKYYTGSGIDWVLSSRKYAALERFNDAKVLVRAKFVTEGGFPLLHIVSECPKEYFLSLILPRGSPYLLEVNLILTRLREAGFDQKWFNDFSFAVITERLMNVVNSDNEIRALDLTNIRFTFYVLFYGYFFSTVVLLCEVVLGKRKIIND